MPSDAEGVRLHVSAKMIASRRVRARIQPRPSRHPAGERHAWQRKEKAYAALRAMRETRAPKR